MHYALCAFVEHPASALLSEEQEHGAKGVGGGDDVEEDEGEGGGEEVEGEEGRRYLSNSDYYNVTLISYQVNI